MKGCFQIFLITFVLSGLDWGGRMQDLLIQNVNEAESHLGRRGRKLKINLQLLAEFLARHSGLRTYEVMIHRQSKCKMIIYLAS